ncbi:Zn-ribbon domain-containing OB-fold protein [Halobacteriaceae archaeon GCM10025711]
MSEKVRDAGYDDLLVAIADGNGYYLECENGHGSLPPRHVCPHCGSAVLTEEPLPESGTVEAFTVVHVPTPRFVDDAPYVTAIVDFGPVRLTGQVVGVDHDEVVHGMAVTVDVGRTATSDERLLVFEER